MKTILRITVAVAMIGGAPAALAQYFPLGNALSTLGRQAAPPPERAVPQNRRPVTTPRRDLRPTQVAPTMGRPPVRRPRYDMGSSDENG